jgi:hypothetical protein
VPEDAAAGQQFYQQAELHRLRETSPERRTVARMLLVDLDTVGRGLDFHDGLRLVIDGEKALAAAVHEVLGTKVADSDE